MNEHDNDDFGDRVLYVAMLCILSFSLLTMIGRWISGSNVTKYPDIPPVQFPTNTANR